MNFRGEGGDFYARLKIAKALLLEYELEGQPERAADIAQNVFDICSAIIDSLNVCTNLPEPDARLYREAMNLLHKSTQLIGKDR